MARDWETSLSYWAQPPGKVEQEKAENAERAIRKAIEEDETLQKRDVSVFAQGSYRNRTNIRTESDVDIAVRSRETFFFDLPEGKTRATFGIQPATYSYADYKGDVWNALKAYLGSKALTWGKKAFDVHENTYRVDADALACFEYRWYWENGNYREGTTFFPDSGGQVINWPQQNYDNGVAKNEATNRRFKALVRILKALRSEMASQGVAIAKETPSFLIECLVWNVPNEGFVNGSYHADLRWVLAYLANETRTYETCSEWGEINEHKYLFRPQQPWTRETANGFLNAAWSYVGYK